MKKKYIERQISDYVKKVAGMYPVVTICGPRQSGKTTLARHLFPTYDYVSMEDPGRRL
ncbi:MAG: AAA family ATPase, partial [Akkermansiaceae bacterium]|nr:AAA family ATPase [Akkermansiaceae bacterium]